MTDPREFEPQKPNLVEELGNLFDRFWLELSPSVEGESPYFESAPGDTHNLVADCTFGYVGAIDIIRVMDSNTRQCSSVIRPTLEASEGTAGIESEIDGRTGIIFKAITLGYLDRPIQSVINPGQLIKARSYEVFADGIHIVERVVDTEQDEEDDPAMNRNMAKASGPDNKYAKLLLAELHADDIHG